MLRGRHQRFAPRLRTRTAWVLSSLLVCGAAIPAHAENLFDFDAGVFHDSNLTRAQNAEDIRPDDAVTLGVTAGQFFALTGSDGLTLTVNARGEIYNRYRGLDNVVLSGSVYYRHKFGLGYAAPWIALSVAASHDDYRDNLRDSNRLEPRAELGTRFSETFDASIGTFYDRRYDNHGEAAVPGISGKVFDLRGRGAYARAGYAATEHLLLGAKVAVRRGDVESTARGSLPIFLASNAIAEDPVFNRDVAEEDELYAYRLRGTTWIGSVLASWALSDRASLNLNYADARTSAAYGLDYRQRLVNLAFVYRH